MSDFQGKDSKSFDSQAAPAAELKPVGLTDIVRLAEDCTKLCKEKAKRFLDVIGEDQVWTIGAVERYKYETGECEASCVEVKRICPEPSRLDAALDELRQKHNGIDGINVGRNPVAQDPDYNASVIGRKSLSQAPDGRIKDNTKSRAMLSQIFPSLKHKDAEQVHANYYTSQEYLNPEDQTGNGSANYRQKHEVAGVSKSEIVRCEFAADLFSKRLVAMANKPEKIWLGPEAIGKDWKASAYHNEDNLAQGRTDQRLDPVAKKEKQRRLEQEQLKQAGGDPKKRLIEFYERQGVSTDPEKINIMNAWRRSVDDGLRAEEEYKQKRIEAGTWNDTPRGTEPDPSRFL